ncbi:MAG: STAS domain-containing protein [Ferruginibacter sp.]|nr:STAS domain-containing protein [Rhodoferax sp.]
MATKDDRPNLLSKMAMFVRNPTKDWSELDRPEPEQETGYDKQALKAMIERKRQNDFVRKREFDNLRKLRRKDPTAMAGAARPSFFQSSLPADAEGRADTLKKIDEIEAQMSKQWWKGKQEAAAAHSSPGFPVAAPPAATSSESARTETSSMAPGLAEDLFAPTAVAGLQPQTPTPSVEFAPTEMGAGMPPLPRPSGAPRISVSASGPNLDEAGFSSSDLFAMEPDDLMTDPELEEAAIRFANGDDAGAESALVGALRGEALVPEVAQAWVVALLDFYRATGQAAAFDRAVMDHAARLDPLRPRWIDIASVQAAPVVSYDSEAGGSVIGMQSGKAMWICPAELTAASMEDLRVALSATPPPWSLDWAQLHDIADNALPFLAGLFGSLCTEAVKLRFTGGDRLAKALRDLTPSGSRGSDDAAWTVRLDALRTMRLQDEFELAALDFCITFEVPPPEWQPALCSYVDGDVDSFVVAPSSSGGSTATMPLGLHGAASAALELSGLVVGESGATLKLLGAEHAPGAHLVVSCKALLRVDFSAAGSILNWVATCHSQGCQVQFRDVHRLVAAFFNVIGITEYARVTPMAIE